MPQSRCFYRLTSLYLVAEDIGFDDAGFDNKRPQADFDDRVLKRTVGRNTNMLSAFINPDTSEITLLLNANDYPGNLPQLHHGNRGHRGLSTLR